MSNSLAERTAQIPEAINFGTQSDSMISFLNLMAFGGVQHEDHERATKKQKNHADPKFRVVL